MSTTNGTDNTTNNMEDDNDYDAAAHRLFRQLNLLKDASAQRYEPLNAIWKHAPSASSSTTNNTGGTVYVGNATAAGDRRLLEQHGITAIVNCQGESSQNYFDNDPQFTYYRFVVSTLAAKISLRQSLKNTPITPLTGGFREAFDFIQLHIQQGHSVLIHCLAGAHRAGTVGTAWIMYQTGQNVQGALALAKQCRPVISPFGLLLDLLRALERELHKTRQLEQEQQGGGT